MLNACDIPRWVREEFGTAELGDLRRRERLYAMAGRAAQRPSGKLTGTFDTSAEREAAYRWVHNSEVQTGNVASAAHDGCARRCRGEPIVFVPVDASNITVVDRRKKKGFGQVATDELSFVRGLHVMTAIAVTGRGVPIGVCGQSWWSRDDKRKQAPSGHRPFSERESVHWLKAIDQVIEALGREGGKCLPWFQMDRGADFREMLLWAHGAKQLMTVRARVNRRLLEPDWGLLWETLKSQEELGYFDFKIPRGRKRTMRSVRVEVRSCRVVLNVRHRMRREFSPVAFDVVYAREEGQPPEGEERVEWMLITNYPIRDPEDAYLVIYGYSLRWRIEAFHRTWKTTCRVEDTQMRDPEAVKLWATVLASVAMRIERLTHLAREQPDVPATEEFTTYEIQAAILLRRPEGYSLADVPTVGEMVRWLADQGGYVGHKSSGPPGAQTLGRGLREIEVVAKALASAKTLGEP